MAVNWTESNRQKINDAGIFTLEKATHTNTRTGQQFEVSLIESPNWVNIIPVRIDEHGNRFIIMVKQFRHGSKKMSIEIPGGLVDPGESPELAARRELQEETGCTAQNLIEIGSINPNPAFMSNTVYTYVAENVQFTHDQNFDEHEDLDILEISENELDRVIASEDFTNGVILSAFYWYKCKYLH